MSAALRRLGAWLVALADRLEAGAVRVGRHDGWPDVRVQERLCELRNRIHAGYY